MNPSAGLREQYMLELINRMRENPAAELPLLLNSGDPDVASALAYFNVNKTVLQSEWNSLVPAPPLAWNDTLALAALNHDQAMLAAGVQSHQLPGEADLGARVTSAGYANWSALGENIFAYANSIFEAHAAFAIDWGNTSTGIQSPAGHRINLMSTGFRDIGIGVLDAPSNPNVGPLLITQDFGNRFSYGNPFLLGTVFNDANANGYYDQGEGLSGVTLTITGAGGSTTATATPYGGYQTQLSPGSYLVTATGGGLFAPVIQSVTIGSNNVHLNFIKGSLPQQSASAPFSDDFNRADSSFQGAYWTQIKGGFGIANNALGSNAASINLAIVNGLALVDTTVQADVIVGSAAGQQADLVARYNSSGNFYFGLVSRVGSSFYASIYKYLGGSYSVLATTAVGTGTGTLRFDVVGSSLKLYYGANSASLSLVAYAYDTSLTAAGTVGVRASQNAVMDNFATDGIALPTSQTLPFGDTFTQANGGQLSRNWTERQGNYTVANNAIVANHSAGNIATLNGVALADVVVQADVRTGVNQNVGVIARYQANGNYYIAIAFANSTGTSFGANIFKYVAGSFTRLNTTAGVIPAGVGTLRLEVVGTSLKLFFGPDANHLALVTYAFDTAITAPGQVGIRALKNGGADNFTTDAITQTTPSALPFTDTFTQINGSQLSRNWTERQGNYTVANNAIVANNPSGNLATLNGVALADVAVQADVSVGANQAAGVIARYQANGNYYLATVFANSTGTSFTANIFKYIKGVGYSQLNTTAGIVASGAGSLRLEVVGTSLKLFFGPDANHLTLVTSAIDTTISAAGLTGIRSSKNTVIDNFTFG